MKKETSLWLYQLSPKVMLQPTQPVLAILWYTLKQKKEELIQVYFQKLSIFVEI